MTVQTRVILQGAEAVQMLYRDMGIELPEAAGASMEITGAVVFLESQRVVPQGATGALARAGYMTRATKVGNDWVVAIGYRGTGYTRIQHYAKRFKHARGNRRLFLTGPSRRARNKIVTALEREVVKRIKAHR
jgi:hypothetical protein